MVCFLTLIFVYYTNWQQSKDQLFHLSHSWIQSLIERGAFKFAAGVRKLYLRGALLTHYLLPKSAAKDIDCIFALKDIFRHCSDFNQKSSRLCIQNAPKTSLISLTCRVHEDRRSAHETKVDLTVSRCSYSRSSRHVLA